jgi:hypothetical protein
MMEAVHGRAAGQQPLVIGRDIHQRLEQRILADDLGVVAIGIAGEDLIDLLRQQRFAAVGNHLRGARVGKALSERGSDSQFLVEQPQRQQTGIRDHPSAKVHRDLLSAQIPEGKLLRTVCRHDPEPPCITKWLVQLPLAYEVRLIFQEPVRDSG